MKSVADVLCSRKREGTLQCFGTWRLVVVDVIVFLPRTLDSSLNIGRDISSMGYQKQHWPRYNTPFPPEVTSTGVQGGPKER